MDVDSNKDRSRKSSVSHSRVNSRALNKPPVVIHNKISHAEHSRNADFPISEMSQKSLLK